MENSRRHNEAEVLTLKETINFFQKNFPVVHQGYRLTSWPIVSDLSLPVVPGEKKK